MPLLTISSHELVRCGVDVVGRLVVGLLLLLLHPGDSTDSSSCCRCASILAVSL